MPESKPAFVELPVTAVQTKLRARGYTVVVDGIYGPQTRRAVRSWQRSNRIAVTGQLDATTLASLEVASVDGLAPATRLDPPVLVAQTDPPVPPAHDEDRAIVGSGPDVAAAALRAAGANASEVAFGVTVCKRESHCTLGAVNRNSRTGDDSWGPFQVNYYGNLRASRVALLGPPATNTSSWSRAAANFLKLMRTQGRCHWQAPRYCG